MNSFEKKDDMTNKHPQIPPKDKMAKTCDMHNTRTKNFRITAEHPDDLRGRISLFVSHFNTSSIEGTDSSVRPFGKIFEQHEFIYNE